MDLIQATSFAFDVTRSKKQFKNISNIISKYCGQDESKSFLNACATLDYKTADTILGNTVKELTGYDNASFALRAFADKFPQIPDLGNQVSEALSVEDKVKVINSFRTDINSFMGCANNE
ncbi:MAG: hypothetical protein PUF29_04810 [Anaerobutyricum hallii]|uniref:hypothetical protein n=1 Tax=Anaerobutyricum hallii TaxID=39488 RepID=UPI00242BC903|nr:hypothetical protein [Anaerobutyricum hallii]MDD6587928.1 hypothetical protein [Anaerobutyricum hallii]